MFKVLVLIAFLFNVAAFAPLRKLAPAKLSMGFETEVGAQKPLGFWDPLGLLKEADEARFNNLRFVELKHGRISMLAVVGHLIQNVYRFPGYIDLEGHKFSDLPNGFAGLAAVPAFGLAQIILSIGWWDLKGWKQVEGSTPGDFGIPYLAQYKTEEQKTEIRAKELNNGRAAQMGILALLIHEQIGDGRPYIINDILGISYNWN